MHRKIAFFAAVLIFVVVTAFYLMTVFGDGQGIDNWYELKGTLKTVFGVIVLVAAGLFGFLTKKRKNKRPR